MQPRTVIVARIESPVARQVIDALQDIGVFTFYAEKNLEHGEIWSVRLEEELARAHAVIVVFDFPESREIFYEESRFAQEVDLVLKHLSNDPRLVVIPVTASYLRSKVPEEIQKFRGIYFIQALSPEDRRTLIDGVLEAWHFAERKAVLPLDELMAEARIIVPRLNVVISQSRATQRVAFAVSGLTALTGLSLSIPSVLSRWSLSEYWLLIGPVLFVFGGLSTVYLFFSERRERKRIQMASFVQLQLKELINRIERFRKRSNNLELAKSE